MSKLSHEELRQQLLADLGEPPHANFPLNELIQRKWYAGHFSRGANGIASLDENGKLLEDAVPDRLTEQSLNATFVSRERTPLNVLDYVTDLNISPVTIAGQINQALTDAASQQRLLTGFAGLTIPIGAAILVPSNVQVDQQDGTLLRVGDVFDMIANADPVAGNTGIRWRNMRLDGDRATDALSNATVAHRFCGVRFRNVTDFDLLGETFVTGTVTGEIQDEGIRAAIMLEASEGRVEHSHTTTNDGSGLFLHTSTCHIGRVTSYADNGSGITSYHSDDCYLGTADVANAGRDSLYAFSGISLNGLRWRTGGLLAAIGCTGAGVNLGHADDPASDAFLVGVYAEGNDLEGLYINNSADVRVSEVEALANGQSATLNRHNIAVMGGSTRSRLRGVRSRNAAKGNGIYYATGTGHRLIDAELRGNAQNGLYADTGTSGVMQNVEAVNNSKVTATNTGGLVLNAATGWRGDNVRSHDDQATKTQESGIWFAGGSGHRFTNSDFTGNKTNDVRKTSSPTDLEFVACKPTTENTLTVRGKKLTVVDTIEFAITPTASVPANSTVEEAFTVTGVATGDHVLVTATALNTGLVIGNARVAAANSVAIRWANTTAGAITPGSAGVYRFTVLRAV